MSRMANGSKFRNKLEERLGTERYEELAREGQQDKSKGDRISAAEVISEFRERPKGVSVDEGDNSMVSKYQDYVNSGRKFNNKAKDYLISQGVDFGDKVREEVPIPVATPTPTPTPTMNADSIVTGDVTSGPIEINTGSAPRTMSSEETMRPFGGISMDNDQVSNIVGNNNTSFQNQDNSIIGREVASVDPMEFKKYFMNKTFA